MPESAPSVGDVVGVFYARQCCKQTTQEKGNRRSPVQGRLCLRIGLDGGVVPCSKG